MEILTGTVLWIVLLAGVIITPMGLPGTFIIASAALLFAVLTDFELISLLLIIVLFGIAVLLEVLEFALSGFMTKRFGGSRLSVAGAIIGGIVGAIWGTMILPIVGTLIGAFAGAFGGAFIGEYFLSRNFDRSLLAGIGAFIGALGGKTMKTVTAAAMVVVIGFYYF
ncbi:MAG: DUF456 domain-containing protein [Candidatus Marinimicrobia bacterium]|nr:DUF456 domain-containing protein [Candidatus Neomarinimicrobiota bacterium]